MINAFAGAIAGIIFGLVLFFGGFSKLKFKRLIENTPTSKIRSIAMGLVEIYGEAIPIKKPIESPLTKKRCVFYNVTIEEYRNHGKHSSWVRVYSDQSKDRFYLKDETGKVLIDPELAKIDFTKDHVSESFFGKDPSKDIMEFCKSKNIAFEGLLGMNKKMRYTETIIAPNDKLYILGTANTNPDVSPTSKGCDNIIIKKYDKENVYFISDKQEKDILKKHNWKIIGGIYGGAALTVFGLIILLAILGVF